MTFFKTTLSAVCFLIASTSIAAADEYTNGVTVINDLITAPELGPNLVKIALVSGLLALASATSASSTSN